MRTLTSVMIGLSHTSVKLDDPYSDVGRLVLTDSQAFNSFCTNILDYFLPAKKTQPQTTIIVDILEN